MKITDTKIADNARKALAEARKDYEEIDNLRSSYTLYIEWHNEMSKILRKIMLLEEILEIKE